MTIYRLFGQSIARIDEARFAEAGVKERGDLQRLLRQHVDVISSDTLIVAEEFGDWEDSRRRIDLLGLDKDAKLVVIELKRTQDGGLMDLQAIRYAAMVSAMTFDKVVEVYGRYLRDIGSDSEPRETILEFLDWEEPDEDAFVQEVRIVLAAADFSKELTTSVLWLNEQGLDFRCVRMKPYRYSDGLLIDVQQVIPLPEAASYQVQIREKQRQERASRGTAQRAARYTVAVGDQVFEQQSKRWAVYRVVRSLCQADVTPEQISEVLYWRRKPFCRTQGEIGSEEFVTQLTQQEEAGGGKFVPRRWFCSEDELIHSGGATHALSKAWGRRAVEAIGLLSEAFPQVRVTCEEQRYD